MEDPRKTFARAILAGKNTFEAAAIAMGNNHPSLFEIASTWPSDLNVLRFQELLQAEAGGTEITRTNVAKLAYEKLKKSEGSDFAAIFKVFVPFMGWESTSDNTPRLKRKVLNIEGKSLKELEESCVEQQQELTGRKAMFAKK